MRRLLLLATLILAAPLLHASEKEAPRILAPLPQGVGKQLANIEATSLAGTRFQLSAALKGQKAAVIALTSTTCPLCQKYLPTFAELEKEFSSQGVVFAYVNPQPDKKEALQKAAAGLKGAYLPDPEGRLAAQLAAVSTTEVFVVDSTRTIIYRGAVDDQYGIGYSLDKPRQTYLVAALKNHLNGKPVEIAATTAPGCVVERPKETKPVSTPVTYHNRISRLMNSHCVECHREGGVGPFSLTTLAEVKAHKATIRRVVEKGIMPPWHAAPVQGGPSPFLNDRSLGEQDKADLYAWIAADGPEGDASDAPLPRTFSKNWAIGKPDLVLKLPEPIKIKATGTMPYQKVVVDTNLDEDKWIQAIEIRPSAKAVVHHVLVFPLGPGKGIPPRAELGGHFAAYVPGNTSQVYPTGYAKKLSKGARLLFQLHYTPNGLATEDQTEIGLIYAKETPHTEVRVLGLAQTRLEIKPGDANYQNTATLKIPIDATLVAFAPHMHIRGKACKYELISEDGKETKVLLDVPHYDFNWQHQYTLAEPIGLKRGVTLKFTAWYDNSEQNPANPDPKATVRWGPQTTDEMLIGYVEYYLGLPKSGEQK